MEQVAKAAGVSLSTASRALSGQAERYRISRKTAAAVVAKASELGFRPNAVARSLKSRRTATVGLVVPDASNPFFAAIAREVTLTAEACDYSVLMADSRETTLNERRLTARLLDRQVEGLIVCPVAIEFDHLKQIEQSHRPLVLVDRGWFDHGFTVVTSDHRAGATALIRPLLAAGHRRIGILQGLSGTLPNEERLAGIQAGFQAFGVEFDRRWIAGDNFTESSGYEACRSLLTKHPELTALVALSAPHSMGAMRAANELKRHIPRDLSIVTFDDHPFIDYLACPLTCASQDVGRIGRTAAQILLDRICLGRKPFATENRIPLHITLRQSVQELSP